VRMGCKVAQQSVPTPINSLSRIQVK
jgi:hypothetical protein